MMVLQVIPDPFKGIEAQEALFSRGKAGKFDGKYGRKYGGSPSSIQKVRRPVRGIQTKGDTFASIRLVAADGDGRTIRLVDAGSLDKDQEIPFKSPTYTNFLLQSVSEDRMEKQQILETFGEPYIFFFGERARVMNFQGVLLNTEDFNWEAEWWHNYENYLRGTRCVENKARVFIFFDETLVSGYILSTSSQKSAQERNYVQFTFQLFVTSWTPISSIGNPEANPTRRDPVENATAARVYLPKRIETIKQNYRLGNGINEPVSSVQQGLDLVESVLDSTVRAARTYVSSAQSALSATASNLNNTLNGVVVRVPVGFAGVLEFDDPLVPAKSTAFEGPVKFGVFSDNVDEYISAGTQYESSVTEAGANRVDLESEDLGRDVRLVEKAKEIWESQGLKTQEQGPLTAALIGNGIGLFRLGSSADWANQKVSPVVDAIRRQSGIDGRQGGGLGSLSSGRRGTGGA